MKLLNKLFLHTHLFCALVIASTTSEVVFANSGGEIKDGSFPSSLLDILRQEQDDSRNSQTNANPFTLFENMFRPPQMGKPKPKENLSSQDSILEVKTHPNPNSGAPRMNYKAQSNIETKHYVSPIKEKEFPMRKTMYNMFDDNLEEYEPKKKKHNKKHRHHHHHKKQPKMEFQAETEIRLHMKNNSNPQQTLPSVSSAGNNLKFHKPSMIKGMIHSIVHKQNSPQTGNNGQQATAIFRQKSSAKSSGSLPKVPLQKGNINLQDDILFRPLDFQKPMYVDYTNIDNDPEVRYLSLLAPITSTTARPMQIPVKFSSQMEISMIRPQTTINLNDPNNVKKVENNSPFIFKTTRVHVIDGNRENPGVPVFTNNVNKNEKVLPSQTVKNIHLPDNTVKVEYSPTIINTPGSQHKDIHVILGPSHHKDLFHPKLSHGELLVPQTKVITMAVKTKTVKLPPSQGDHRPPIPVFDEVYKSAKYPKHPQIDFVPQKKTVATKPPRPITIISHTQMFVSLGNQTDLKKKNSTSNRNVTDMKKSKKGDVNIMHEKALEALKPHCPNGASILNGGLEFINNFSEAHGWKESLDAFKITISKAQEALGRCFQKMWDDTKKVFVGRKKRQSQVDLKKLAQDFKDDFIKNVAGPVATFFGSVSSQVASKLEKRSVEPQHDILDDKMVEEAFTSYIVRHNTQDG